MFLFSFFLCVFLSLFRALIELIFSFQLLLCQWIPSSSPRILLCLWESMKATLAAFKANKSITDLTEEVFQAANSASSTRHFAPAHAPSLALVPMMGAPIPQHLGRQSLLKHRLLPRLLLLPRKLLRSLSCLASRLRAAQKMAPRLLPWMSCLSKLWELPQSRTRLPSVPEL